MKILIKIEDIEMANNNKKPKLNPSGIVKVHGRDVITYQAMLDYGYQKGLQSLNVEVLQLPSESNGMSTICAAHLETKSGEKFSDIGDANPENVPRGCAGRSTTIASTRAKSRVLATAYNIRAELDGDFDSCDHEEQFSGSIIDLERVETATNISMQKNALAGGGSKPISEKQAALISRRANDNGVDPENYAREHFNKSLAELTGSEADVCIKALKK